MATQVFTVVTILQTMDMWNSRWQQGRNADHSVQRFATSLQWGRSHCIWQRSLLFVGSNLFYSLFSLPKSKRGLQSYSSELRLICVCTASLFEPVFYRVSHWSNPSPACLLWQRTGIQALGRLFHSLNIRVIWKWKCQGLTLGPSVYKGCGVTAVPRMLCLRIVQ